MSLTGEDRRRSPRGLCLFQRRTDGRTASCSPSPPIETASSPVSPPTSEEEEEEEEDTETAAAVCVDASAIRGSRGCARSSLFREFFLLLLLLLYVSQFSASSSCAFCEAVRGRCVRNSSCLCARGGGAEDEDEAAVEAIEVTAVARAQSPLAALSSGERKEEKKILLLFLRRK